MTDGSLDINALIQNAPMIFGLAIVGLLGCLILLAVGLNMWSQERKPKASAPPADGAGAEKKPGFALPKFNVQLPRLSAAAPASDPNAVEVLRVLRDRLTGRVVVEIGGKRYNRFSDLADANVQEGLMVTLHDLQTFAGSGGVPIAAPAFSAPTAAVPAPSVPAAAPEAQPAAPLPTAAPTMTPPAARPADPPPLRMPSMNPFRQAMVLRDLEKAAPPPPKPIAEQIDEVLQVLVVVTPYAQRGLHVRSGPRGNAIFELDGRSFHSIDDIPEAEAQAIFRDAVKRWEQQQ